MFPLLLENMWEQEGHLKKREVSFVSVPGFSLCRAAMQMAGHYLFALDYGIKCIPEVKVGLAGLQSPPVLCRIFSRSGELPYGPKTKRVARWDVDVDSSCATKQSPTQDFEATELFDALSTFSRQSEEAKFL